MAAFARPPRVKKCFIVEGEMNSVSARADWEEAHRTGEIETLIKEHSYNQAEQLVKNGIYQCRST
jgi:hypothetical protein